MSPSFVPLRCEAGQCGRLLSGGDSCTPQCSQLSQCSQCISRPQCGWCASQGGNGAGRCLQGGLDGKKFLFLMFEHSFFRTLFIILLFTISLKKLYSFIIYVLTLIFAGTSEGVCPLRNSSWSFLHCPEEDECANGHHHCNSTQDCHDLPQGFHCTCKQGYILSRYESRSAPTPQSLNTKACILNFIYVQKGLFECGLFIP